MAVKTTVDFPFSDYAAITTSDTVNIPIPGPTGLYVGVTGDVVLVKQDGTTVLFKAMPAGLYRIQSYIRVNATNTTATNLVAMYN